MSAEDTSCPLGRVTVLGAHILDVLGRPVEAIPPGQGSARLQEIRATAAGTAVGADTSGLSRKSGAQTSATILPIRANGERPALHVPTGRVPTRACSCRTPTGPDGRP